MKQRQWFGVVLAFALVSLAGGCTFDSSLQGVSCDQEGARSNGRVCQNGHWVAEADVTLDGSPGDTTDTLPDTAPPDDATDTSPDDATDTPPDDATDTDTCVPTADPTEVCDGVDNNCDGQIDEGVETTFYLDADGDTYGVTTDAIEACTASGDYTATDPGDCDDGDPAINPGATEICNNFDDDCDGDTDEGCPCSEGETSSCYDGPGGTAGVGICQQGTKTCDASGDWGSCQGQVPPETEVCDDADDNDCDGDNNCADSDCDGQSCGGGGDVCHNGVCCSPQSNDAFCTNPVVACGQVTATDNCGVQRTVECGGCPGGSSCANNACHEDANKCGDGKDNDGDGLFDCEDPDCDAQSCGDGDATCSISDGMCHENSNACDDDKDNDGDGDTDCFDSDCAATPTTYYRDHDGDGWGATGDTQQACGPDGEYTVTQGGDCDDNYDKTFPGAAPNDSQNDCMRDEDGDDWGDANPSGGVTAGSDCDDTDADIHPNATEQCADGVDSDCDGVDDANDPNADTWCSDNQGPSAGCGADGGSSCCLNNPGTSCQ